MFKDRMLDKSKTPDWEEISSVIGPAAGKNILKLEKSLAELYDLNKELRFPFGNEYGWGYKYSHKAKHLFYLFFEKNALTATLQIGDGVAVEELLPQMSSYARQLWIQRYPCGKKNGGWIHYQIKKDEHIDEVLLLAKAKCPPPKKKSKVK